MVVKRVPFQPYAIDGNVVYEIACKNHEWHRKHEDGQCWKTTSGKNKDLKETRRCAKCIRPLQCQNKRCVMYRCYAQSNTKSFKKMGDDYIAPFLKRCCTVLEFQNGAPILKQCCTILEHLVLPHFKTVLPHFGTFIFTF